MWRGNTNPVTKQEAPSPGHRALRSFDAWQHLFCAVAQALHAAGLGKLQIFPLWIIQVGKGIRNCQAPLPWLDRLRLPPFTVELIPLKISTLKVYLSLDCKPNHSLSANLSLNLHHGQSAVHCLWACLQGREKNAHLCLMDGPGKWGVLCLCFGFTVLKLLDCSWCAIKSAKESSSGWAFM